MPTTDPNLLHVAVGLIQDDSGRYFLQQRQAGKPREGQWEYPGGKIEAGETPVEALIRELHEELGIVVSHAEEFMQMDYQYPHAHVYLYVFQVTQYAGKICANEGQSWCFAALEDIQSMNVLDAVLPINARLIK